MDDKITEEALNFWSALYPFSLVDPEIEKELIDYYFMMTQYMKVLNHVTDGRMTKLNYHADSVIAVVEDVNEEVYEESVIFELAPIAEVLGIDIDDFDYHPRLIEEIVKKIVRLQETCSNLSWSLAGDRQ